MKPKVDLVRLTRAEALEKWGGEYMALGGPDAYPMPLPAGFLETEDFRKWCSLRAVLDRAGLLDEAGLPQRSTDTPLCGHESDETDKHGQRQPPPPHNAT